MIDDCPYCEGSGETMARAYEGPNSFEWLDSCPHCKGTGDNLAAKCCAGERGPLVKEKRLIKDMGAKPVNSAAVDCG
jgi:DnaJ-class molecular chaperone